jgi:hypothetical protein
VSNPKIKTPLNYADITAITMQRVAQSFTPSLPWRGRLDPYQFPERPKEIVLGYVEAWRWWILAMRPSGFNDDSIYPGSNNCGYLWNWDGENMSDAPPTFDNTNGLYAYTIEGIEDHQNALFGRVALYGDVVHCKHGYRAEKARILDVWMDVDYIRENPSRWELLKAIPQVKGTFDTHDPRLYKANGERGDYQCLILESQKELSGTSLSDGLTTNPSSNRLPSQTMLVIDRRSRPTWNQPFWNQPFRAPFTYGSVESRAVSSGLTLPYDYSRKEWVVKPDGDVCDYCERIIADGEAVAVSFEFPNDMYQAIFDHTFQWIRKQHHLRCVADAMIEPFGSWDDLDPAASASNANYAFKFTGWKTMGTV